MNKILSLLALFALAVTSSAAPPVVSNVTASQRSGTKLVDIYYDLSDADGDAQLIQMQVSADGGLTYTIPCVTLNGHIGSGVTPGNGKHIVWNAGADWNGQFVPSTKVRVTANDGTTPPPPPGMVYIPAGVFQMGDSFNEIGSDALPLHNVQVDGIFIDRYEVTKELWQSVQTWGAGQGYNISAGNFFANTHPVVSITWYDMVKWCNARSEKDGLTPCYYTDSAQTSVYRVGSADLTNVQVKWNANGYRLPTEAEWEKAARGGILGQRYPWGNIISGNQANYSGSGDPFESNSPSTTPVGYYNGSQIPSGVNMANGYGLYDMAGNVRELCWDMFKSTYYGTSEASAANPHGPLDASSNTNGHPDRVMRGGSSLEATSFIRSAVRLPGNVLQGYIHIGFRSVRGCR